MKNGKRRRKYDIGGGGKDLSPPWLALIHCGKR